MVRKSNDLTKTNASNIINLISLSCIFFMPLFNGLFFKHNFYPFCIIGLLLLICINIILKKLYINIHILIILSFELLVAISSLFTGINKEESVYGVFESIIPLIFLYLITSLIMNKIDSTNINVKTNNFHINNNYSRILEENINSFFNVVFFSSIVVSAINIIVQSFSYNSTQSYRLTYVIPYSNTLAAFEFLAIFYGIHLLQNKIENKMKKNIIHIGIFINLLVFTLTYSRIMWALAVIAFITYFYIMKKSRITYELAVIITNSLICSLVISSIQWKFSIVPIIIFTLINDFILKQKGKSYTKLYKSINTKLVYIAFILFALILLSISFTFLNRSSSVFQRILSINFSSTELIERFSYYKDSFRIFKDYFNFGVGPGGWDSIQYRYQTSLYATKYVHSSLFQAVLDFGLSGLIIYISKIFIMYYFAYYVYKKSITDQMRNIVIIVTIINTTIIAHSLLDIDLEFPVINILFWINISILSVINGRLVGLSKKLNIIKYAISVIALILVLILIPLSFSSYYYSKGLESFQKRDFNNSRILFKQSITINPISASSYYYLGQTLKEQYQENPIEKIRNESIDSFIKARNLDKMDPKYSAALIHIYSLYSDYDNCIIESENLIKSQPLVIEHYEKYSDFLLAKVKLDLDRGNIEDAKVYFNKILLIEDYIENQRKKISDTAYLLKNKPNLTVTSKVVYNTLEAKKCIDRESIKK